MPTNVKKFYNNFNFADMVLGNSAGSPPALIETVVQADVDYIIKKLSHDLDVLEVGCGFGRLVEELSKISKNVIGIDFSETQLSEARKKVGHLPNVELHNMHAEQLGFPNDTFDVVVCLNSSLGNMPGIETEVVKEMVRVAKPGGLIVVHVFANTPALKEAQFANYRRLNLVNIQDHGDAVVTDEGFYSRRFSKQDLEELFAGAGLAPTIVQETLGSFLVEARKQ